MFRSILAATLSIGLALPAATPAQAGDAEDVAKIVGGIAALYILSQALENRNDRNVRRVAPVQRAQTYSPHVRLREPERFLHQRERRGIITSTRPHQRPDRFRHDVRLIPDQCYREIDTRRGVVAGYSARCMQNRVARPGILPSQCISQVRTDRGIRNLYGPRCLRQQGWSPRTARR